MRDVSCLYLKNIIDICILRGADADEIYCLIEGGKATLENTSLRMEGEVLLNVLKSAIRSTGDKELALKVGEAMRPDSLDDVGYAVTFCDTLRESMLMVNKYQCISQNFGKTELVVDSGVAKLTWTLFDQNTQKYADYVDLVFSGYATVGRWLIWQSENPLSGVEFCHEAPNDMRGYQAVFGPKVKFGAAQDVLCFDEALLDLPLPSANPDIKSLMTQRLDTQLASIHERPSTAYRARRCITSEMPNGRPEIEKIARILGQSERTLRRNLSSEGTSFREVLTEVYKEACEIHLRNVSQSHAQIALTLGFSDQTAYTRAFKRWFDVSPEMYRKAIKESGVGLSTIIG